MKNINAKSITKFGIHGWWGYRLSFLYILLLFYKLVIIFCRIIQNFLQFRIINAFFVFQKCYQRLDLWIGKRIYFAHCVDEGYFTDMTIFGGVVGLYDLGKSLSSVNFITFQHMFDHLQFLKAIPVMFFSILAHKSMLLHFRPLSMSRA